MSENSKILGVIGGMGPLATNLFYGMIIEKTEAHCDRDHLDMVILNHASMPDRTAAILSGDTEEICANLIHDANILAHAGASYIAVPCNTSHYFLNLLKDELPLPYISMPEVAAEKISGLHPGARVGILGTDGTIRMGLYHDALTAKGLTPITVSDESRRMIMSIIYDDIKAGGEPNMTAFQTVERELLQAGADCVVLACTELSCLKRMAGLTDFYIDAMDALAERAIVLCGKELKHD